MNVFGIIIIAAIAIIPGSIAMHTIDGSIVNIIGYMSIAKNIDISNGIQGVLPHIGIFAEAPPIGIHSIGIITVPAGLLHTCITLRAIIMVMVPRAVDI